MDVCLLKLFQIEKNGKEIKLVKTDQKSLRGIMATANNLGQSNLSDSPRKRNRTVYLLLGTILVLALIVIGYYFRKNSKEGIPQELVLGPKSDTSDLNFSGLRDPDKAEIVKYHTNSKLADIETYYKDYFSENGWSVTGDAKLGDEYQMAGKNSQENLISILVSPALGNNTLENGPELQVILIYQE